MRVFNCVWVAFNATILVIADAMLVPSSQNANPKPVFQPNGFDLAILQRFKGD
jgi:hypothetical protein